MAGVVKYDAANFPIRVSDSQRRNAMVDRPIRLNAKAAPAAVLEYAAIGGETRFALAEGQRGWGQGSHRLPDASHYCLAELLAIAFAGSKFCLS